MAILFISIARIAVCLFVLQPLHSSQHTTSALAQSFYCLKVQTGRILGDESEYSDVSHHSSLFIYFSSFVCSMSLLVYMAAALQRLGQSSWSAGCGRGNVLRADVQRRGD